MRGTLPTTDAGLLLWAQNFYSVANPSPTTFGLTAAVLTAFNTALTTYSTALAACDPGQRSKASVAAKNTARAALVTQCRSLINLVDANLSVTNAQKIELGIKVRGTPAPIPAPAYSPTLKVESVDKWTVWVKLSDAEDSGKRGKPDGVFGAAVYSYVGINPPSEIGAWRFEGNVGRVKFAIPFAATLAPGTRVWLTAQWFNGRKQAGPACDPVATNLQGGSVAMAA
jgi:hypothetical protein